MMLRTTICIPVLTRCALHLHQHSYLFRLSSVAARKDKLFSYTVPPHTVPGKHIGSWSFNMHSSANDRGSTGECSGKPWHGKALGMLVGALGTVVVLGLGTVLSKTQEEGCSCDNEPTHRLEKISIKSEEAQVGKDVVGIKMEKRAGEAIIRHTESKDLDILKQRENLSSHEERVRKARRILRRHMEEAGAPGMVVAVTVNGKQVWTDGLGFADLENGVRCSPATVMRIASISKALTMTAVARLWEEEKLDLDAPVQKYIPSFPVKTFDGKEVTVTTRQLLSHKSGIRHYKQRNPKKENKVKENGQNNEDGNVQPPALTEKESISIGNEAEVEKEEETATNDESKNVKQEGKKYVNKICTCCKNIPKRRKSKKKKKEEDEFDLQEYYIKEEFETVQEALELFQNDELFFKPGEGYLYTTHGWTVVSAVVEAATQKPFTEVVKHLFYELGLNNTYLDMPSPIIYNRASCYVRDEDGKLKNAPYVDNSYKWAGGGFLSTVEDLCKFGNAMLYASQQEDAKEEGDTPKIPGYLKASTVRQLWTPVEGTKNRQDRAYGMGWETVEEKNSYKFCRHSRHHAYHTGGAVGASSILLILPQQEASGMPPQGVVVALLTNIQSVALHKVALEIAKLFEKSQ